MKFYNLGHKTFETDFSFLPVQVYIFGFSLGGKLIFLDNFRVQQGGIE